jgi:hypothetical protein
MLSKAGWKIVGVRREEAPAYVNRFAIDGNPATQWISQWNRAMTILSSSS